MNREAPDEAPVALDDGRVAELETGARSEIEKVLDPAEVESSWDHDELLDRILEAAGGAGLLDERLLAATGVVLGRRLARVCKLEWVEDPAEGELGVRLPGTTVLFYPRRMVSSQLELARQQGRLQALRLAWLVASTRDYLKSLVRFHPTQG